MSAWVQIERTHHKVFGGEIYAGPKFKNCASCGERRLACVGGRDRFSSSKCIAKSNERKASVRGACKHLYIEGIVTLAAKNEHHATLKTINDNRGCVFAMKQRFSLSITADEMQMYYRGHVRSVLVESEQGVRVQFPVLHLRRFMGMDGVRGRFEIEYDDKGKFIALRRI